MKLKNIRIFALTLAVLLLAGCQTMQMKAQQEEKQLMADCQSMWEDPKFDPIRNKIFAFGQTTPTRYLLVNDKVADSEKELLLQYADIKDECAEKSAQFFLQYTPFLLAAAANGRQRSLVAFTALFNGSITYGEYNRLQSESRALTLSEGQTAQATYAQLSIADRQNQIQANRNFLQAAQQLAPQPQLRPNVTHTNCHWLGNNLTCTTR